MWSEDCRPLSLAIKLNEALPLTERIDILLTLAHFYIFDQSSAEYMQQLESLLSEQTQLALEQAHLTFLKGVKKQAIGDWAGSTRLLESALETYRAHEHVRGEVEAMIGIAVVLAITVGPSDGIFLLEQAREKIEEHDLPLICKAYMLNQFAVAHLTVELYNFAESYARQSHAYIAKLPMQQEGVTSRNAMRVYVASAWSLSYAVALQGRHDEAIQVAEKGLDVIGPLNVAYWNARLMQVVGYALTESKKYEAAVERLLVYIDSVPPTKGSIYDDCYALLGIAYACTHQHVAAEPLLLRAVDGYEKTQQRGAIYLRCLKCLALIAREREEYEDAFVYLEKNEVALKLHKRVKTVMKLEHLTEVHNYESKQREASLLKTHNQQLTMANQLLQKSLTEQSELIKLVAHDIYSPLTSIMLRTRTIMRQVEAERTDQVEGTVDAIRKSADYINDIVFHFQTIDQLENDQLQLEWQVVSIENEMLAAIERNQPLASQKQIEVRFCHTDAFQVHIYKVGIKQVLDNLLSNAIKYSHPNSVVEISAPRLEDNMVKLDFIDQGVGFKREESKKLFTKFGRLESSRPTSDERSVGLGLYIVRQLLIKMNGDVVANSDGLNTGATFTISLPLAR